MRFEGRGGLLPTSTQKKINQIYDENISILYAFPYQNSILILTLNSFNSRKFELKANLQYFFFKDLEGNFL